MKINSKKIKFWIKKIKIKLKYNSLMIWSFMAKMRHLNISLKIKQIKN